MSTLSSGVPIKAEQKGKNQLKIGYWMKLSFWVIVFELSKYNSDDKCYQTPWKLQEIKLMIFACFSI